MEIIYRILGYTAAARTWLRRQSARGMTGDSFVMLLLLAVLVGGTTIQWNRSVGSGSGPRSAAVSELAALVRTQTRQVRVRGEIDAGRVIPGPDGDGRIVVALRGAPGQPAVLLERDGSRASDSGRVEEVSGIIEPLPAVLQNVMAASGWRLANYGVSRTVLLREGKIPASPAWIPLIWVVAGIPAALLMYVSLKRSVVFRPDDSPGSPIVSAGGVVEGAAFTGDLEAGTRDSVFLLPVVIQPDDDGRILISARVEDAAGQIPEGSWISRVEPGTLDPAGGRRGSLYAGGGPRPALLLDYEEAGGRKIRAALSFPTAAARDAAGMALSQSVKRPIPQIITRAETSAPLPPVPTGLSGRVNVPRFLVALALLLPAAAAAGILYFAFCTLYNVVIFSSLIAGAGFGLIAGAALRKAHCRSARTALATGAALGLVMVTACYLCIGEATRELFIDSVSPRLARVRGIPVRRAHEELAERYTMLDGALMYIRLRAEDGIGLGGGPKGGLLDGKGLTGGAAYAYFAVDALALILACAAVAAGGLGSTLYCEPCSRWMRRKLLRQMPLGSAKQLVAACTGGDWAAAAALPSTASQKGSARLFLSRCPSCGEAAVIVNAVSTTYQSDRLYAGGISAVAAGDLEAAVGPA